MALEFVSLNEIDTKELRKSLKLPITKQLVYFTKECGEWKENKIVNYQIESTFSSGSCELLVTLESGIKKSIHSDYLSEMQSPSFLSDNTMICDSCGSLIWDTPSTYCVVDLETTGFNHNHDEIIEIGAIKYENRVESDRYSALIKPKCKIGSNITKLTGITSEMLDDEGIELIEAISNLNSFLGNGIVVGHNINTFDKCFLDDAYLSCLGTHFKNDYVDTQLLAKKMVSGLDNYKLETLASEYAVDYTKAHRALEDCVITHLVYEAIVSEKKTDTTKTNVNKTESLNNQSSGRDGDRETEIEVMDISSAINESDTIGWKQTLAHELTKAIKGEELPLNSLLLLPNKGRKDGKTKSYSVCIYEPDLVENSAVIERNSIVIRIAEGELKTNPDVLTIYLGNLVKAEELKLTDETMRSKAGSIRINQNSDDLIPLLMECVRQALKNYSPKASSFACCSRYEECSDEGRCIHENKLYSKACQYRKNLEKGQIFYGIKAKN